MNRQTRQKAPKNLVSDLIFQQECYAILGGCFEVYKNKGSGFHEPVYQECLGIEFQHCRIPAIPQPGLSLEYRDIVLVQKYFPDFVCFAKIIVIVAFKLYLRNFTHAIMNVYRKSCCKTQV